MESGDTFKSAQRQQVTIGGDSGPKREQKNQL